MLLLGRRSQTLVGLDFGEARCYIVVCENRNSRIVVDDRWMEGRRRRGRGLRRFEDMECVVAVVRNLAEEDSHGFEVGERRRMVLEGRESVIVEEVGDMAVDCSCVVGGNSVAGDCLRRRRRSSRYLTY